MTAEPAQDESSEDIYILCIVPFFSLDIKRFYGNHRVHLSASEEDKEYCLFLENICSLNQRTFPQAPQKAPVKQWLSIYLP